MPIDNIARALDRNLSTVIKYAEKQGYVHVGLSGDDPEIVALRAKLRERAYWNEICKQLSDGEVYYFEQNWIEFMRQFNTDITYSEEIQLKQWIILDILIDRAMAERKAFIDSKEKMEAKIAEEEAKPVSDKMLLGEYKSNLLMIRGAITAYDTTHTKLLSEYKYITGQMKAARNERIKKVEGGNETFSSLLRILEDETNRRKIGDEIAIVKIAGDKALDDLSDWHKYGDGMLDRPILNSRTVEKKNG